MCCTILCNILYKLNSFSIVKAKAILLLVKLISKKKSLYTDILEKKNSAFNKKNLASIDEVAKMPGKSEDIEMPNIKHIFFKNKHTTSSL